jgi:hypothetical protein
VTPSAPATSNVVAAAVPQTAAAQPGAAPSAPPGLLATIRSAASLLSGGGLGAPAASGLVGSIGAVSPCPGPRSGCRHAGPCVA